MSTQTIGILIIVILLLSFVPNFYMLYKAKQQHAPTTRYALMVGVDAILLVLVIAALVLLT